MTGSPLDNCKLARAFRDLEGGINLARDAVIAAELLFDDAQTLAFAEKHVRQHVPGLDGYKVLILTEDQYAATNYIVRRARDEADALRKAYYAGFEAAR